MGVRVTVPDLDRDPTVEALGGLDATSGIVVQTGADAFTKRSIAVSGTNLSLSNGSGAAGNPTLSLASFLDKANTWQTISVSGTTLNLGAATSNKVRANHSGGNVTSFGTPVDGLRVTVEVIGAMTLKHSSEGLELPGAADIETAPGDYFEAVGAPSATHWEVTEYHRGGNTPVLYGSGVATALGVDVGSAGAPVVNGGALGTPASGNLMNCNVVRSCANNAALQALTAGTGLLNGALYETAARTSDNDGGGGRYQYSSSDQSSLLVRSTKTVSAVDTGADTLTVTAHGFYTGRAVIASAADAGLSLNTLYYVAVTDANTVSLHTTRANAFAGTSKVDITALAGSLSLKLLADPGQGVYVLLTGAALDGSQGAFIRQSPGAQILASWFGMWASASGATNTKAIYDAWQFMDIMPDSNAQLSWGSTLVLADDSCTLADETITLDGKGGIIVGGDNTKLVGTYTSSKAAFIFGSSAYVAGVGLGYFAVRLESFGANFTSHGYCFRSYIRCFQARDVWTANASVSDYDIHGAWNLGQIVDCHGQGGTGRWLTLSDESNHFTVENSRAIFYTATWTIHVTGCYAPKIHQNDIEYNTGGIYLVSSAATRVDSAQVSENWFEGDTSKALLLDNTDYSVENFRMEGNTIYGFTADATSGVVEIGVSGGAGIIDNPLVEGNSFQGPSTTQLQFNSAAAKYTNVSYNINARNAFTGGAAISFATRPEIETYPIPRSYTCTLGGSGSPTIGNGTLTGEFTRIGNMVEYRIVLTVGSTTSFGSGAISLSMPYVAAVLGGGNEQYFGQGYYLDSGTSEAWSLVSTVYSGGSAIFPVRSAGGGVTGTAPITIATGDQFQFFGRYRAVNL